MRPEHEHYDEVEAYIRQSIKKGHAALFDARLFDLELQSLEQKFGFPYDSLVSFYRNCFIPHIKRSAPRVKSLLPTYVKKYEAGASLLELAKEANYSPHLFSRYMVEEMMQIHGKKLTDTLRDPERILVKHAADRANDSDADAGSDPDLNCARRLAFSVLEAQQADPLHNPMAEIQRHMLGLEYECRLELELRDIGIAFETEEQLRARGTARTPDILLSSPLAISVPRTNGDGLEWRVICWIDSKALFGDVSTHTSSVLPQAEAYVHRFGAGVILYWFGHAPLNRLDNAGGDLTILGWELPTKFMLPTGEFLTRHELP